MPGQIEDILRGLESHFEYDNYKGWDIFDGLSTPLSSTFLFQSHFIRLGWIQFFKKSPINLRPLFCIKKDYNPKALALILSGSLNRYKITKDQKYLTKAYTIADLIIQLISEKKEYFCWGYNFPWEARAFSVPAFQPNMIVSCFCAQAFLDLYEIDHDSKWLKIAIDVSTFIQKELIIEEKEEEICLGYIPNEQTRVHNANLIGACLLSRLFKITNDFHYKEISEKSVRYSVNRQNSDGSWFYGEQPYHKWIDNFHTGYNLVAIKRISTYLNNHEWDYSMTKGLKYHLENHFLKDFTPKYYNNYLYPIDIHNFAQGIVTFQVFDRCDISENVINKCLDMMYGYKKEYFFYYRTKYLTNKINYFRWSQAWMYFALTNYLVCKYEG